MKVSLPQERSRKVSPQAGLALWRRYKATGDIELRNQLVMTLSPLVRYIVFKKVRELPARCEVDDFISCGWEALIQAIDRFDPTHGTTLEQFAWTRIHGAVIDELRRQDWAPRSLRRRERELNSARDAFIAAEGRHPTVQELAEVVDVTVAQVQKHQEALAFAEVGSLNSVVASEEESAIERIDTIASVGRGYDPIDAAEGKTAKSRFRTAFSRLSERERKVAVMLYAGDHTLRDIGKSLGVSESRVCQIHAQLKRRIRADLAPESDLFAAV